MFRNTRLPFGAVAELGNKFLMKFRSSYGVAVTFVTVLLLGVAAPAQALEPSVVKAADEPSVNFMCYIGSPTLAIFDPAKSATQKITGILLGLVILAAVVGVIWGGIRIMTAGKHKDKAGDGVRQISNTVFGLIVIFGGLVVLGILVTVMVSLSSYGCS